METTIRVPGTDGPDIVVRRPAIGSLSVLVDGAKAQRLSRRKLLYRIPLRDGTTTDLQLVGQWRGLHALVAGHDIPVERRIATWETVLAFLPFVLIAIGGLLGGLFAAGGAAINVGLTRAIASVPVKVVAMLSVTVLSIVGWLATAFVLAPLPSMAVGSCMNGISLSTGAVNSFRTVDCASRHDAEVVGLATARDPGKYPGMDTLLAEGQAPCAAALVGYIGLAADSSDLTEYILVPDNLRWTKGDRTVTCVVLAADGSKLQGSVRNRSP